MNTQRNIFFAAIVSAFASIFLSACQDRFDSRDIDAVYGDRRVSLEFSADAFLPVLRSALPQDEERRIDNLYVWIFDEDGGTSATPVFSKVYLKSDLMAAANSRKTKYTEADEEVPSAKGLLEEGIKLPVGKCVVYMVANLPGGNYYKVGNSALSGDVSTLTPGDLDGLIASLDILTKDRDNGFLLMSAKEVKEITPSTTRVDVRLKRLDARVDFSIGLSNEAKGRGDTFTARSYSVHNIPNRAYLFERPINPDAPGVTWDASAPSEEGHYFVSNERPLDFLDKDTNRSLATFYMPESRKPFKGSVKGVSEDSAAQYRARAKQNKEELPSETNPYLKNTNFKYAPDRATYIEVKGEYRSMLSDGTSRTADVTYRVLLGDFKKDMDDYNTLRDHWYTYLITVNGVDDILVEVDSNKSTGEQEPAPDNDGLVYDSDNEFQLDSHYEQRTFGLRKGDLGLDAQGNVESIAFYVSTPFQAPRIVFYSKNELQELATQGFKVSEDKWTDNDWLRFFIHNEDNTNPDLNTSVYYTDMTEDDLLTVEQLLYRLSQSTTPSGRPFKADDEIKITVFVNENYYESEPSYAGKNPKDKDLWKRFVNTPDRKFMLLVPEHSNSPYSPDGQSAQFRSILTLSQYPIRTIFQSDAGGVVRVWGVESVDETPNLDFTYLATTEPLSRLNKFFSNGFANTWNLLPQEATDLKPYERTDMDDFYQVIPEYNLWKTYTLVDDKGVRLNPNKRKPIDFNSKNFNYAMFAPFSRNRDENRDNRMQRREMKWFNPSPAEAVLFFMTQRTLPSNIQFLSETTVPTVLFTNRGYRGSDNRALYMNNPFVIINGTSSQNYLGEFNAQYKVPGGSPGERTKYSHNRLVRDLGILDEYPASNPLYKQDQGHYTNEDLKTELPRTLNVVRDKDNYLIMRADHISPLALRKVRAERELPMHSQYASINSIYQKGFEVAKWPAREYGADYREGKRNDASKFYDANKRDAPIDNNWQKLQRDINSGFSPCATYWQYSDYAGDPNYDKGTWRVPNMAEMQMMMVNLFDWDSRENKAVYNDEIEYPWGSPGAWYNVGTRTGDDRLPGNSQMGVSYSNGYSMHVEGYLRMVGTSDMERWLKVDQKLFVRCVRDLPE
ncbi:MAG: DUF4906 domain-containing protein [Bacteroidales bacterium]|nr:DUF4906 domain-containing protein [Bacteroidales bacterium]